MNLPSKTTVSSADYISHLFTDFPRQQINPKYIDIWHIQHILCVDLTAFGIFTDQWSKLSNRHTFSDLIIWHTKGRVTLPKRKNFRTISNGRCPPYPLIFRKLCCNFFPKNPSLKQTLRPKHPRRWQSHLEIDAPLIQRTNMKFTHYPMPVCYHQNAESCLAPFSKTLTLFRLPGRERSTNYWLCSNIDSALCLSSEEISRAHNNSQVSRYFPKQN